MITMSVNGGEVSPGADVICDEIVMGSHRAGRGAEVNCLLTDGGSKCVKHPGARERRVRGPRPVHPRGKPS